MYVTNGLKRKLIMYIKNWKLQRTDKGRTEGEVYSQQNEEKIRGLNIQRTR